MALTPNQMRTCRNCGTPISNKTSLRYRVGSECRADMTPEQQREALELTKAERQPGYIPPERRPSADAVRTNATTRRIVATMAAPDTCDRHGGVVGECSLCEEENDPDKAAARVIRLIREEREDARRRAEAARGPSPARAGAQQAIREALEKARAGSRRTTGEPARMR